MEASTKPHSQSSALDKQTWERENDITSTLDPNSQIDTSCQISQPWTNDPLYFKSAKISDLALLKMVIHASSVKGIELVGLLKGKIDGDAFLVTEAFSLPVEYTDTESDAQAKLLEYYETETQAGGLENVVGWYRSHPRYSHSVSRTDLSTQRCIQQFKEPSLAVVIGPSSTTSLGKVDIRAFRTYPEGYTSPIDRPSKYSSNIPQELIEKYKNLKKRHQLSITCFKTSVDRNLVEDLWNVYWTRTICKSVDKEVSVENEDDLVNYVVSVSFTVTDQYSSPDDALEAVCVKLMEEIGSSKSQIVLHKYSFLFARLTKKQAEKLSGIDCVKEVRRELEYHPTRVHQTCGFE